MAHFVRPSHLLLFVFFLSSLESILATRQEGEALVKWKNSLAPSSFLHSWSLTNLENLCNWTGITCNSAGSVSEINLCEKQHQEQKHKLLCDGRRASSPLHSILGPSPTSETSVNGLALAAILQEVCPG